MWQLDMIKPLLDKIKLEDRLAAKNLMLKHFKLISKLDKSINLYGNLTKIYTSQAIISLLYSRFQDSEEIKLEEFSKHCLGYLSLLIRVHNTSKQFNGADFILRYIEHSNRIRNSLEDSTAAIFCPGQSNSKQSSSLLAFSPHRLFSTKDTIAKRELKKVEAQAFEHFPESKDEAMDMVTDILSLDYFLKLLQLTIQPSIDSLRKLLTDLYEAHMASIPEIDKEFELFIDQVKELFFNSRQINQNLMTSQL